MNANEQADNYGDAIDRFVIGYNKGIILNTVTMHSLEILDGAMAQVENGLNTIVSAFEEIRAGSSSTSINIDRIDGIMDGILDKNRSMDSGIAERMREIEHASDNAKSIASLFAELKEKTKSVAGMTDSIQDVSDRTGILAINASIEAARAGAVGRGFRIIANEVRGLATQTGAFAKQIETNVTEFQTTVDAINAQMNEFVDLFSRFRDSFSEVLANFNENAQTINEAGSSLSEITGAIREESQALNDGLTSLEKVNDSMRETHAILEVVQASHQSLDSLLERGTTN